jgi:eukaryotic-like serine/threonine-protein kinase
MEPLETDRLRRLLLLATKVGLLAMTLALIAALSAYYTVRNSVSGRDVQVPDLTRMTIEEATALLKQRGLLLEQAAQRNDDAVEEGRILAQDPPSGSAIKLQRKVKVVVSLGNKVTATPELRGGAARKAQITLQQQGMRIGSSLYVYSKRVAENLVIAQDPLPGSIGPRSGTIGLLVSRGERPRTYVMPSLVGRAEGEATAFLARAGLKAAPSRHDGSRPAPRGTVVAQDPQAGYPVSVGDIVTLTVAGESQSGG